MGFGSFFKKLGKVVGKVAASPIGQIGLGMIPGGGIVSTIARQAVGGLASKYGGGGGGGGKSQALVMPGGGAPTFAQYWKQGAAKMLSGGYGGQQGLIGYDPVAAIQSRGASGSWAPTGGGRVKRYTAAGKLIRYMNPTNVRACRRAIRRIKSTRRLLKSIERQLPTRTVHNPGRRVARRR